MLRASISRFANILVVATAAACAAPGPLPHDVYVWQRVWTPRVALAVDQATGVDERVVLAAEDDVWTGFWTNDGQPIRAPRADWRPTAKRRGSYALALRWSQASQALTPGQVSSQIHTALGYAAHAGFPVTRVHLDADIPTARLPDWAAIVASTAAETDVPLSVLCLVDHIGKPGWSELGRAADQRIVQLHSIPVGSIENAQLFDPIAAKHAIDRLPADGAPVAIALPTHTLRDKRSGRAVRANPAAVLTLLNELAHVSPRTVDRIIWFRLPVADDPTTWTTAAWTAVRQGRFPRHEWTSTIDLPPADWQAAPAVRVHTLTATGEDHGQLPTLRFCGVTVGLVMPLDGRYQAAKEDPSPHCVQSAPTADDWLPPQTPFATHIFTTDTPITIELVPPTK